MLRILEAIGKILLYSKEYNTADDFIFSNDQRDYNASLLLMMHIGEQAAKVSSDTKDKFLEIQWQHIKGFRNRVAHDYINVDKLIVFSVIKTELPKLQNQISNCIKQQLQNNIFNKEEIEISRNSIFYMHIDFSKII
ncbi:MAG TPA: HepT-like ribonuclease domain-containing protein [Parafilimonas sp.]|nr:HepT-like ribonuclease domain-containing protein [Parafilimonas sp.]